MEKGKDRGINTSQHRKKSKQVCVSWQNGKPNSIGLMVPKVPNLDVGCRVMPGLCRQWASREPHFVCFHFSKMG